MIDPRNLENRRLEPRAPRITAAKNAYWLCAVCEIRNHVCRDCCEKCGRRRMRLRAKDA